MELKKTVKYDGKMKGLHMVDGQLVDQNGEIIDILSVLHKAYGETPFDLSTTTKTEETINLDDEEDDGQYELDLN